MPKEKADWLKKYDEDCLKRERDANAITTTYIPSEDQLESKRFQEKMKTYRDTFAEKEDKMNQDFLEWAGRQNQFTPKILESVGLCLDVVPLITEIALKLFKEGTEGKGPTLKSLSELADAAIMNQKRIHTLASFVIASQGGSR